MFGCYCSAATAKWTEEKNRGGCTLAANEPSLIVLTKDGNEKHADHYFDLNWWHGGSQRTVGKRRSCWASCSSVLSASNRKCCQPRPWMSWSSQPISFRSAVTQAQSKCVAHYWFIIITPILQDEIEPTRNFACQVDYFNQSWSLDLHQFRNNLAPWRREVDLLVFTLANH